MQAACAPLNLQATELVGRSLGVSVKPRSMQDQAEDARLLNESLDKVDRLIAAPL